MTENNFLYPTWDVYSFGRSPVAIDIMTAVDFGKTFEKSKIFTHDGLEVRTIHKADLIKAKKASNRPTDQDDLENI